MVTIDTAIALATSVAYAVPACITATIPCFHARSPEEARKVIGGPEVQMFKMHALATSVSLAITITGFFVFIFAPVVMRVWPH
jgi:hypothetical protein